MPSQPDRPVFETGVRQEGVVLRPQALALGMTDEMLRNRVERGLLTRVRPGVFLLPGYTLTTHALLNAATAALPAVVSHESAAELHRLPFVRRGLVVVTVPSRSTHVFPGVIVHQSTDLSPGSVVKIEGLPATSLTRTLFDLAPVLGPRHLRSLVQHCLIQRLCKWTELEETLTKLARRGRPGSKPFRDVLTEIGPGVALSESVLELLAYELLICHGLPEPVRQHPLPWRDTRDGRVDLVYPHARLIIELDGRRWHTQAEAFEMDRRRDNLAQLAGWRVLRFTWQQLKNHPEEFIAVVAQALAQQSPVAGS